MSEDCHSEFRRTLRSFRRNLSEARRLQKEAHRKRAAAEASEIALVNRSVEVLGLCRKAIREANVFLGAPKRQPAPPEE